MGNPATILSHPALWRLVVISFTLLGNTSNSAAEAIASLPALRPPSVPLVVTDPYFSIWSPAEKLTDRPTRHWTREDQPLTGLIRVDGKVLRFLGIAPASEPALPQTGTEVLPTRTICTFSGDGIALRVTFMTPALPDDIDLLSRPVTYVTWDVAATDAKTHAVSVYFDASAAVAVNDAKTQKVVWAREKISGIDALRVGTEDQRVLARYGDGVRIDWGYLYVAAAADQKATASLVPADQARHAFAETGKLALADDAGPARTVAAGAPVLAYSFDFGSAPWPRWTSSIRLRRCGNRDALRGKLRTQDWPGEAIWLRREIDLASLPDLKTLRVWRRHEGEVRVFINGVLAMIDYNGLCGYYAMPPTEEALSALKPGKNTLAVYAFRQNERDGKAPGRFVDVGLVNLK